jgi:hypothetical protein
MKDKRLLSAALTVHHNALCAYVVLLDTLELNSQSQSHEDIFRSLRALCEESLTDYMIPKHFIVIEEIPLNSNGKVDRNRLPQPESISSSSLSSSVSSDRCLPTTVLEKQVVGAFASVLRLDAAEICCKGDSFFGLGGNSVTAIQLIFTIRTLTNEILTVQELFRSPTVQGVCKTLTCKKSEMVSTEENLEMDGYNVMCLQTGDAAHFPPLLLFNPAGASGLWYVHYLPPIFLLSLTLSLSGFSYTDLILHLPNHYPVYCVDDGVILRDIHHNEASIAEVSLKCAQLVKRFAQSYATTSDTKLSLILGGWSYGGVIAVNVAEVLSAEIQLNLEISAILLFDSPLRASTSSVQRDVDPSDPSLSSVKVQQHFSYCTELLREYYKRPICSIPALLCPVLDLRAEESDYVCDLQAIQEISSGRIERFTTNGTHFTMLFGANASSSAGIIIPFLLSLPISSAPSSSSTSNTHTPSSN